MTDMERPNTGELVSLPKEWVRKSCAGGKTADCKDVGTQISRCWM